MPTPRCFECSKKTGLLGFDCRCGKLLCAQHRLPSEHACSVDYRAEERQRLKDNNAVVVASKIDKLVSVNKPDILGGA